MINRLTSRGREVVAKFYSDMAVLPPANIADALSVTTSSSLSSSIASTPVRATPLPSIPSSNNRTADNHGISTTIINTIIIILSLSMTSSERSLDIGSPATPRAAQHPLVKEVRGQQDEADKSMIYHIINSTRFIVALRNLFYLYVCLSVLCIWYCE